MEQQPQSPRLDPLEDPVGELFVNRQGEFALLDEWVKNIPWRPNNSIALIGRRRTGKTAILIKFFNRLFYEQDKVLPVYISFAEHLRRDPPLTMQEVGDHYLASYLACFLAFRYRRPEIVRQVETLDQVRTLVSAINDPIAVDLLQQYDIASRSTRIGSPPAHFAIHTPRSVAGLHGIQTVVMVDEFQVLTHVYDPFQQLYRDLTSNFQKAVESRVAPMLVSGSVVSLLVGQALGGMLAGRFLYHHLEPLSREYAHELVFRLGERAQVPVTEGLAEAIFQLTGGYPYSIQSIVTSHSPARQRLPDLNALEEVLLYELGDRNGYLYQQYDEEFIKYRDLLNGSQLTKKVLFWVVKYPNRTVDADQVAHELGVTVEEVQSALRKLYQADMVYRVGADLYEGPSDPMLRRFLEYNYRREIEKMEPEEATKDWRVEYRRLRGQLSDFMGEVAEMYVKTVMDAFDGRTLAGQTYFNRLTPVSLPKFTQVERRGGVIKAGVPLEIDLTGVWNTPDAEGQSAWLVQVKYTQRAVSAEEISAFLAQTQQVMTEREYHHVTRWYICKGGYTDAAAQMLQAAGVLYSDRSQFNALATLFGFHGLPA